MIRRVAKIAAAATGAMLMLAGCASNDGYGGYGGADVAVGMSYGYYDPYYPYYYPGYPCCWVDNGGRPIEVPPPGNRPDRPTTLPAGPGQLPAERPATRPATPATRPAAPAARPATRPTPAPRPMGGGRRR
ncbi:MAG: hypothetical protein U1F09_11415 [Steroidobacteraceae bacterium]